MNVILCLPPYAMATICMAITHRVICHSFFRSLEDLLSPMALTLWPETWCSRSLSNDPLYFVSEHMLGALPGTSSQVFSWTNIVQLQWSVRNWGIQHSKAASFLVGTYIWFQAWNPSSGQLSRSEGGHFPVRKSWLDPSEVRQGPQPAVVADPSH